MTLKLTVPVKILPHGEGLPLPAHQTEHAACMDLMAAIDADIVLSPGKRVIVPTGLSLAIPEGYHVQIWPRSGLAAKNGIDTMAGMIDSDYRGEYKVVLINHGEEDFVITRGMRIAQCLVAPYASVTLQICDELPTSERGEGGFGSTGTAAA